jgi:hypothetical protein
VPAATAGYYHEHKIPLWWLFLALLALTAGEVGLFEFWHHSAAHGHPIFPTFAMVLLLLLFTLPKAVIVMVFFMHLRFEKQLIVTLALLPFITASIAVLVTLSDNLTLKNQGKNANFVPNLVNYQPNVDEGEAGEHAAPENKAGATDAAPAPDESGAE